MATWLKELGDEIRKQRDDVGWTQDDLAQRSGLSRVTINKIEMGHRAPNLQNLAKISAALGGHGFKVHGIWVGAQTTGAPQVVPVPPVQMGLEFDVPHRYSAAVVVVKKSETEDLAFSFSLVRRNVA